MEKSGVSIVNLNYNTGEYIFDLPPSIRELLQYEPMEIIAIDNFSTDGSREALEFLEGVRYIVSGKALYLIAEFRNRNMGRFFCLTLILCCVMRVFWRDFLVLCTAKRRLPRVSARC